MKDIYIDINNSSIHFANTLYEFIKNHYTNEYKDIVIVCIGTDRCTGDSLGPLVGYKLEKHLKYFKDVHLYGTLENPVHAKNLRDILNIIETSHNRPFIIAIDACLGNKVNHIKIGSGSLRPGAATNKDLPSVGHMNILGIVNVSGFMELMVLQNTRLNTVMNMSDYICRGLQYAFWKKNNNEKIDIYN